MANNRSDSRNGQNGYNNNQGGYNNNQGGYSNNQGGYSNNQGGYNNSQGGYNNSQGGYNNSQGGYNNNQGGYNNNQGGYNNSQGGYNNNQRGYNDGQGGYNNNQRGYNDSQGGYNNSQRGYNDSQKGYNNNQDHYNDHSGDDNNGGKNNKMLPILIGILGVLIVAAVVLVVLNIRAGSSKIDSASANQSAAYETEQVERALADPESTEDPAEAAAETTAVGSTTESTTGSTDASAETTQDAKHNRQPATLETASALAIDVQQIDASEFPKIRLYLNIRDSSTGDVPATLDAGMFYLEKQNANASYVKQVIRDVTQLNEAEALTVNMVADVSGSMDGSPIIEAKSIMCNFINSMQFNTGDMVELTSFANGVSLEQTFTGDRDLLISKVNGLSLGNMTSLYDALYAAVERVASQSGARCVIAFTDGKDNYSNNTAESVIAVAQRYHIPIFIIGIGSGDYSTASYIATSSGGMYYNASNVSSMQLIYDEIYRMEKELYLLEFEDNTGAAMTDTANIKVGYSDLSYEGECDYTYVANTLISTKGVTLYDSGPEAVVEKYIRNFDLAVSNSDYSYIADYIQHGSSLYDEQSKYVLRDIQEQLDSYEFVSVDYSDSAHCTIVTRETYYVQVAGKALQLMTQESTYAVELIGGEWKMTTFLDIEVLSRLNQ